MEIVELAPGARRWKERKMLKCSCQKLSRAALILAFLATWPGVSDCQGQSQPPNPQHPDSADDRAAEARALASALAAPKTNPVPSTAAAPATPAADSSATLVLREGDTLHISFSGAHSLDSTQTIRRDGKITLEMVGEIKAAALTAPELEQQLLKAYGDQLVVKEVAVTVQTSVFKVFVTGAVLRPGPIISDRVETPLEAVIEAGIDTDKSNLKKVAVIREHDDGKTERFILNLDAVMKGKPTQPFALKSMDKIYVPAKFTWF
jgi:protein involved in polysaccharide export with SLBB domain